MRGGAFRGLLRVGGAVRPPRGTQGYRDVGFLDAVYVSYRLRFIQGPNHEQRSVAGIKLLYQCILLQYVYMLLSTQIRKRSI
jgi:hypothetical protein